MHLHTLSTRSGQGWLAFPTLPLCLHLLLVQSILITVPIKLHTKHRHPTSRLILPSSRIIK